MCVCVFVCARARVCVPMCQVAASSPPLFHISQGVALVLIISGIVIAKCTLGRGRSDSNSSSNSVRVIVGSDGVEMTVG